ncbi:hypothetical protein V6Z11_D07G182300 [Gossypium hirsutum]
MSEQITNYIKKKRIRGETIIIHHLRKTSIKKNKKHKKKPRNTSNMDSGKVAEEHFSDREKKQSKKENFKLLSSSDKFGPDASMQVKENLRKNIFKKNIKGKNKNRAKF